MYGGVWLFDLVFYGVLVWDWYVEHWCWFRVVSWGDGHNGQMGGNGVLMCPGVIPWVGGVRLLGWLCDR